MIQLSRNVTYEGPFFRRNPGETFRQNLARAVKITAEEGAKITKTLTPLVTGEAQAAIYPKTESASLFASVELRRQDAATFPRANWLEKGKNRRAKMRKAPPRPFRKAATALRRAVRGIVVPELLKGLE